MKNCIITVEREFGSGGHRIGQLIAEKHGVRQKAMIYISIQKKRKL